MASHRIFKMSFSSVYPHYVAKAEKKGRSKCEVDEIIQWLTGYRGKELEAVLEAGIDFETFFSEAPSINPARDSIKGVICGVRIEEIEEPISVFDLTREYYDLRSRFGIEGDPS